MEPDTAKVLGGVGSILAVLGIDIVGYILVLVGMRGLGDYYNDEGVKRNSLWWFIWGIVGGIAVMAVFYIAIISWAFGASVLGPAAAPFGVLVGIFAGVIAALLIAEIFGVLSAIYLKRVYAALSARSGEGLFNTAAELYWWGSLLTIVLVGLILVWISWIISAVAFFSMKPGAAARAAPPPPV